ncbi:unnamed protein product [Rotaria sordida]|uniref:Riboflavin transporter n=1 Tax=Rotaria sordida TaxID=392033 RepID=A0A819UDS2_9BILA|nr:unnamed protein product [Rotaria sordida]CAF4093538.1 unnamed protein product [Rotaria sordida]
MEVEKKNVASSQENKTKPKKLVGYILFLLFGIGTWLNLNGIWIELPLLIPRLPEGWSLSPQLGMASNIANIGPLIIALIRHLIGKSSSYEFPSICVIFAVGISVPLILSFTWFKQIYLLGKNRSIYLLVLGFFLALVNCTSSVTYLPFVNHFDHKWLNIYFAGESLSSLIPAILGLIQGVGQKPECVPVSLNSTEMKAKYYPARFSVQIYLICLSIIMLISFIAFIILWKIKVKNEEKSQAKQIIVGENAQSSLLTVNNDGIIVENQDDKQEKFTRRTIIYLIIILWTSILLIGCIPSLNSYSLNPYGPSTFHYVIILCQCCYPFVSLLASTFPNLFTVSTIGIIISTISGSLAFFYIFLTAYMSPCSPFVDEWSGKYIIAIIWALVYLIFYYERIVLGNYFNKTSGHRGLFWYGLLTQAGAFIGALFIFILTTFDVFKERDLCTYYPCY